MSGRISVRDPEHPKRVLIVASNPATSGQTGWLIGLWWAELTHPYWEFVERGYVVEVASPDAGALRADSWSDPRDASGYSADDLLSSVSSPRRTMPACSSRPRQSRTSI
jgi:putative intracellular protease/amidase